VDLRPARPPWPERPVFGKVRYMNANGLERKFDMAGYLRAVDDLIEAEGR
jgi:deoxyribodipyrimidine photo-lyase